MTRLLLLGFVVLSGFAQAVNICSTFDRDPANAGVVNGRLPDGGIAPDQRACCDGRTTDDGCHPTCGPFTSVSTPVDTLSGFAWLDRTDVNVTQPWGQPVSFSRHYSTAWAQGAGSTSEVGPLGLGWNHSFGTYLLVSGGAPGAQVVLRNSDTSTEEYNLFGTAYASRHPARKLAWDATTQLYTAQRPDGGALVFDGQGQLRVMRSADGGEAQLRYAGDDVACATSASMPAGALCRVDFLFGRQLWFQYTSGRLTAVAWDSAFANLVVSLAYTNGLLTSARGADGAAETYAYDFLHKHLTANIQVPLLTSATDADGKMVESFTYHQPALSPSRVDTHATPDSDYHFTWAYYDTAAARVVRETTVRGSRENMKLTWADGDITSVCMLDSTGQCDVTRALEYVRAPGLLANACARESSGHYRRSERDGIGRITADFPGLTQCDVVTDESRARRKEFGYLGDAARLAWQSSPSVDTTAPAGFAAFTAWDFTVPASAVDALCGSATCQRPDVFNAAPLTTRPQRRIEVGRTLLDVDGTWGAQVQVTSYGFDSSGRLASVDGPRRDVMDVTTLDWSPTNAWAMQQQTLAGRVLAQYADFDRLGNARSLTDENGNVTALTFDPLGRLGSVQRPSEATSIITRLPSGRLDSVTEGSGVTTQYSWDSDGQISSLARLSFPMATPDFERTYTRTDKRLTTLTDSDTGTTVRATDFGYDSQGRAELSRASRDSQSIARLSHVDDDGRLAWIADEGRLTEALRGRPEDAKSHQFTNDAYGNLSTMSQLMAGGWTTMATFTWDTRGNMASFTDSKGVTLRYVHDDFGRLVEVSSPDFGLYRLVYDEAGNVSKVRRPDGAIISYSYDASNRLLSVKSVAATLETYEWGTEPAGVTDCADGLVLPAARSKGRLARVTDASGDWYFGYWPTGRLRYEAQLRPGATCAKTLISEFDAGGLLTAMRYPSGARIEFGYPAAGQALHDRPSTVSLVRGGQSIPVLTNVQWQEGELTGYTTSGGVTWSLARWLEGSPATVALTGGSSSTSFMRQRKFGKTTAGQFTSSFDGWGNPLDIEEALPAWSQAFTTNDFPALTSASAPAEQKAIEYLASGDRYSVDGVPYCYEGGTHRLASVGAAAYGYRADGSLAKRVNAAGEALTLCNDERGRLESTVGAGAEVNRIITNFRHQRVAEVWPLNGLREDFRVDAANRLLSEEGVGSLESQYPRPVREYVWLGMHPVAVLDSTEDAAGAVTPKGVTFIHSGHLTEPLSETDESGRVLRQYVFTPFGERRELAPSASAVSFETDNPYTNHSTTVALSGARAMKLHFTEIALAMCDSIIISGGYGGPVVAEIPSSASGDYWTEWLPTDSAYVELRAKGCGTARGFKLVEALPDWGSSSSQVRTDSTTQPYPAAGQQFRVSLGAGGFVRLSNLNLASCDAVEARTTAGQTVWKWVPLGSYYEVWTPRLVGDVDVGIWGQGCNATEQKFGFTLAEVRSDSNSTRPVSLGLPGHRLRADGTIDNWFRTLDSSTDRYLSPEPLLQSPNYVRTMAQSGMSVPTYVYAANNPLRYADRDGLDIKADESCKQGIKNLVASLKKTVADACTKPRTTCLKIFDEAGLTAMITSKEDVYTLSCSKVVPAQPGEDACGFANATWWQSEYGYSGDGKSAILATGNSSCIVAKTIAHELAHLGPTGIEHPDALTKLIFDRIQSCVGADGSLLENPR